MCDKFANLPHVVSLTHMTIISQWQTGIHLQVFGKFAQTKKVSLGQQPSVERGRMDRCACRRK